MSESQKLNTNPEILLKKRKNADRLRLEKQEAARLRKEEQVKKARAKKNRFMRMETILAKKSGTKKELKRISRVSKVQKAANQKIKLVSQSNNILSDMEDTTVHVEPWNEEPKLLLVIRISSLDKSKIPSKASKVLKALRLTRTNAGTFIKLTPIVLPLLKIIAPYVVIGTPNMVTVRKLIQKHGITVITDHEGKQKEVLLDDNTLIEENLGEFGIICTEDLVHEIYSLGENFKQAVNFIRPFKLAPQVSGWGPMAKLKRIQLDEEKQGLSVSQRGNAPLIEIDINKYVEAMN